MQEINKTLEEEMKLRAAPAPLENGIKKERPKFVKIQGESKMARRLRRRALAR